MTTTPAARQILDREYLEIRCKILELAASFDRLDRAGGEIQDDPRIGLIHEGLQVLASADDDRAEQIQLVFSREYDNSWREKFGLQGPRKAK